MTLQAGVLRRNTAEYRHRHLLFVFQLRI